MSVRALADAVKKTHPEVRGASYGGVRQYSEDNVTNPRVDLLRALAEVLGIRGEWLAFGQGAMTEHGERVRLSVESGEQASIDDQMREYWDEQFSLLREEFGEGSGRLNATIVRLTITETLSRLSAGLPDDDEASDPIPQLVRCIGGALRQPFLHLPLHPYDLTDDEFTDYVSMICLGLRRLGDGQQRRARLGRGSFLAALGSASMRPSLGKAPANSEPTTAQEEG